MSKRGRKESLSKKKERFYTDFRKFLVFSLWSPLSGEFPLFIACSLLGRDWLYIAEGSFSRRGSVGLMAGGGYDPLPDDTHRQGVFLRVAGAVAKIYFLRYYFIIYNFLFPYGLTGAPDVWYNSHGNKSLFPHGRRAFMMCAA